MAFPFIKPDLIQSFSRGARRAAKCFALLAALAAFGSVGAQDVPEAPAAWPALIQTKGIVTGIIYDRDSGRELSGATVTIGGTGQSASTGVDGTFRIDNVGTGEVTVVVAKEGYRAQKVERVEVIAREAATISTSLTSADAPEEDATGDEIVQLEALEVVSAAALANSAESFTALRRETPVPADMISAEELRKFIASDVSEAIIRIPGVSIAARGSFAVIRGLGERYNTTTLNGIALPSSDPERQGVELDQLPTRLMDGLVVYKSFMPHMPGNLTGGGVEVKSTSFPTKRTVSLSFGVGVDEGVFSNQDFLTYPTKGSGDRWARGASDRISTDELVKMQPGVGVISGDPAYPITSTRERLRAMPRASFFYGDSFKFSDNRRLGVMFSLGYESSRSTTEGFVGGGLGYAVSLDEEDRVQIQFDPQEILDAYAFVRSTEKVQLGVLAGLSFRLNQEHQFSLTAFSSQVGIDQVQYDDQIVEVNRLPVTKEAVALGTPLSETAERFRQRFRYRERNLSSLGLDGRHYFPGFAGLKMDWTVAYTSAYQDEPDRRFFNYARPHNEVQYELNAQQETDAVSMRTWSKVAEEQRVGHLNFDLPLPLFQMRGASLRFGGVVEKTDRTYVEKLPSPNVEIPPGAVVENPEDAVHYFGVKLRAASSIDLLRDISAAYANVDLPLTSMLRVSGGLRIERTEFTPSGYGSVPGGPDENYDALWHYILPTNVKFFPDTAVGRPHPVDFPEENRAAFSRPLKDTSLLPAVSLAVSPHADVRAILSYSETLARPSLRELGSYYSFNTDDELQMGNSTLKQSAVKNLDFRLEWFLGGSDLVAVSLFKKEIEQPIEKVAQFVLPQNETRYVESWLNNPATAELNGVEVEVRRNLGFISDRLRALSVGGNATFIDAQVAPISIIDSQTGLEVVTEKGALLDPEHRPRRLFDQPRWLANADVSYRIESWKTDFTVSYFASDRILTLVHYEIDQYRDAQERLDFTLRQKLGERIGLKLSAKNLTNPEQRLIRDPEITRDTPIVDRRWHDGRSYSLTISYDF